MEDITKRFGGNLNEIEDEDGNNILIMAVSNNDSKMCDFLLQKGVHVNH